nr:MAG TPA: hypothetical protein [Caudoviricetes sp.]
MCYTLCYTLILCVTHKSQKKRESSTFRNV